MFLMLSRAASLYLLASSLVCLSPSDWQTRLNAVSASPGWLNLLRISLFSSLNCSLANRTGAVARPSFRSAAEGFPACSYKVFYSKHSLTSPSTLKDTSIGHIFHSIWLFSFLQTEHFCGGHKVKPIINQLEGNPNILSVFVSHVLKTFVEDDIIRIELYLQLSGCLCFHGLLELPQTCKNLPLNLPSYWKSYPGRAETCHLCQF